MSGRTVFFQLVCSLAAFSIPKTQYMYRYIKKSKCDLCRTGTVKPYPYCRNCRFTTKYLHFRATGHESSSCSVVLYELWFMKYKEMIYLNYTSTGKSANRARSYITVILQKLDSGDALQFHRCVAAILFLHSHEQFNNLRGAAFQKYYGCKEYNIPEIVVCEGLTRWEWFENTTANYSFYTSNEYVFAVSSVVKRTFIIFHYDNVAIDISFHENLLFLNANVNLENTLSHSVAFSSRCIKAFSWQYFISDGFQLSFIKCLLILNF